MPKQTFDAKLIRIYCNETDTWNGRPLYEAIVEECIRLGIAGATVYRGLEGFGTSSEIHRLRFWSFGKDAPIMISIIDKEETISRLLPQLDVMLAEGLIATSNVQVIQYSSEPASAR